MNKKITSALILLVCMLVFACKKSTAISNTPTSTTPATSFSVDGKTFTNITHTYFSNGGNYGIIAYGTGGNPEIQITFFSPGAPQSGNYIITSSTPGYGQCSFVWSDTSRTSYASSGLVNITVSTSPNNVAAFSNISLNGPGGAHNASGTITY